MASQLTFSSAGADSASAAARPNLDPPNLTEYVARGAVSSATVVVLQASLWALQGSGENKWRPSSIILAQPCPSITFYHGSWKYPTKHIILPQILETWAQVEIILWVLQIRQGD